MKRDRILIVEDEPLNSALLEHMLGREFVTTVAVDGGQAIELARQSRFDLILLDAVLPDLDGFQVCEKLKADPRTGCIPIIFVTALCKIDDESRAFQAGAVDFISKPYSPAVVLARVRTQLALHNQQRHLEVLVRRRTKELEESRLAIIRHLGQASEMHDRDTGLHIMRVSQYAYHIARALGLDEKQAKLIQNAAPLHDVGKIGIPERILRKPGRLDRREWETIQTHCRIGYELISGHESEVLKIAALCAFSHHERWDGSGYPRQLTGEAIPLAARIIAVADVFDVITSERPYKKPLPVEEAVAEITRCSGSQFDPQVVMAFLDTLPEILRIMEASAAMVCSITDGCLLEAEPDTPAHGGSGTSGIGSDTTIPVTQPHVSW